MVTLFIAGGGGEGERERRGKGGLKSHMHACTRSNGNMEAYGFNADHHHHYTSKIEYNTARLFLLFRRQKPPDPNEAWHRPKGLHANPPPIHISFLSGIYFPLPLSFLPAFRCAYTQHPFSSLSLSLSLSLLSLSHNRSFMRMHDARPTPPPPTTTATKRNVKVRREKLGQIICREIMAFFSLLLLLLEGPFHAPLPLCVLGLLCCCGGGGGAEIVC